MQANTINWRKNLFFVWLSQLLSMAGFAAILPFIPIYIRNSLGIVDEQMLGAWVSAFNFFGLLSFCLAAPLWGMLADKFGNKLMLLRANCVCGFLFPCLLLAPNVVILIMIRFCISGLSGTEMAAQTLIATNTPKEHHGFALGTLSTAFWSGNMVGFLIGGMMVNFLGFFWAFMTCGALYLISGVLVLLFVKENFVPAVKVRVNSNIISIAKEFPRIIWLILLLFVLMGVARKFDEPYIAIMVEKINGVKDVAFHAGWISALAAAGGILSGVVIGKLCDRYSPRKIALPSLAIATTMMLIQSFALSLPVFSGARFVNFVATGGLEPAFQTMLSRSSPENRRGILFGLASSLCMTGILLGSALGGVVIYFTNIRSIFIAGALLFLLPALILFPAGKSIDRVVQAH